MLSSHPYPLTIVYDRYSGTYSGGKFTAWNLHFYEIPGEIADEDIICSEFWFHYKDAVGKGNSIEEAVGDLIVQLKT